MEGCMHYTLRTFLLLRPAMSIVREDCKSTQRLKTVIHIVSSTDDSQEDIASSSNSHTGLNIINNKKPQRQTCFSFKQNGQCRFGNTCRFLHEQGTAGQNAAIIQERYRSRDRNYQQPQQQPFPGERSRSRDRNQQQQEQQPLRNSRRSPSSDRGSSSSGGSNRGGGTPRPHGN